MSYALQKWTYSRYKMSEDELCIWYRIINHLINFHLWMNDIFSGIFIWQTYSIIFINRIKYEIFLILFDMNILLFLICCLYERQFAKTMIKHLTQRNTYLFGHYSLYTHCRRMCIQLIKQKRIGILMLEILVLYFMIWILWIT